MSAAYDVIVLGAGASGLMLAAEAAKRGRRVLVLEKANKVGKKILMSGGGKCNFTNLDIEPQHFLSANPHFVKSALSRYSNWDFIGLVCDYGIAYEERKHGQLFTLDGAKHILNLLLSECDKTGLVRIVASAEVTQVQAKDGMGFDVIVNHQPQNQSPNQPQRYSASSVVVATGGLSIPTLGGSGIGYDIATQFGHSVLPTRAGLVPFTFSDGFKEVTARLSGNALDVTLSNARHAFNEALLFTHRGLSGPSALQLSNYWQVGESFHIHFFPQLDLAEWLLKQKRQHSKNLLRTVMSELAAKSLVLELQQLVWPNEAETALAQITDARLTEIAQHIQNYSVKPSGTEGYRTAEVTLGGVDTREVSSKTMQSLKQDGLFFIGEVLDVTGHLGGYNFQWAWSSGYAAAEYV